MTDEKTAQTLVKPLEKFATSTQDGSPSSHLTQTTPDSKASKKPKNLREALNESDEEAIRVFIYQNPEDCKGYSLLHIAVMEDDIEQVKKLLRKQPELIKEVHPQNGCSALHIAVTLGRLPIVKYLIEKGADPYLRFNQRNALQLAAVCGRIALVQYFIEEKALDPAMLDKEGFNIMDYAVINKNLELISYLCKFKKILPNKKNRTLFDLLGINDFKSIQDFLALFQDNPVDYKKCLFEFIDKSIYKNDLELLENLIPIAKKTYSQTLEEKKSLLPSPTILESGLIQIPLVFLAIKHKNLKTLRYLIEKRDERIDFTINQQNALFYAAFIGDLEICKYLSTKIDPAKSHVLGDNLLHIAASKGHLDIVKFFAEEDKRINIYQRDSAKRTPLHRAVYFNKLEVVQYLIQQPGAKKHLNNPDILYEAVYYGHLEMSKFLIEQIKLPTTELSFKIEQTTYVCSALYLAASRNHFELFQYLLEKPEGIMPYDFDAVLWNAARYGNQNMIKLLYQRGFVNFGDVSKKLLSLKDESERYKSSNQYSFIANYLLHFSASGILVQTTNYNEERTNLIKYILTYLIYTHTKLPTITDFQRSISTFRKLKYGDDSTSQLSKNESEFVVKLRNETINQIYSSFWQQAYLSDLMKISNLVQYFPKVTSHIICEYLIPSNEEEETSLSEKKQDDNIDEDSIFNMFGRKIARSIKSDIDSIYTYLKPKEKINFFEKKEDKDTEKNFTFHQLNSLKKRVLDPLIAFDKILLQDEKKSSYLEVYMREKILAMKLIEKFAMMPLTEVRIEVEKELSQPHSKKFQGILAQIKQSIDEIIPLEMHLRLPSTKPAEAEPPLIPQSFITVIVEDLKSSSPQAIAEAEEKNTLSKNTPPTSLNTSQNALEENTVTHQAQQQRYTNNRVRYARFHYVIQQVTAEVPTTIKHSIYASLSISALVYLSFAIFTAINPEKSFSTTDAAIELLNNPVNESMLSGYQLVLLVAISSLLAYFAYRVYQRVTEILTIDISPIENDGDMNATTIAHAQSEFKTTEETESNLLISG